MSLRWRATGELLCGAKSEPMKDDTYIDDHLHYHLSVIQKVVIPDVNEEENGKWYWLHAEHIDQSALLIKKHNPKNY